MLMFLGYLFLFGITTVKGAGASEFQTMKTRLENLYEKFADMEIFAKSYDDFQNTFIKALRGEKLERIKFENKIEKQVNALLEAHDTVTALLKEQAKKFSNENKETRKMVELQHKKLENDIDHTSKAVDHFKTETNKNFQRLRNLTDNVGRNTEELSIVQEKQLDHADRVQRMFNTFSQMLGKCGSDTNQRWLLRGNTCYYFSFGRVTWNEAVDHCKGMNARLVTIEDEEENTFLVDQVKREQVCYRRKDKYFGTVSTTRSGLMCQRWDSQIPHRHNYNEGWRFPEGRVSDAANYCRDPNEDRKPNTPWCYTVSSRKRFEECSIPKCAETDETETIFWIGINDVGTEGVWKWAGDDLFTAGTYTNWDNQQPDNYDGNEDCGVMWVDRKGKWNDGSCGNRYGFVCETPVI